MKKLSMSFLAIALVFGLCIGSAQAGTWLAIAPAPGPVASEIFGTGSGVTEIPTLAANLAQYTFDAAPNTAFLVDITLSGGATWGTALGAANLVYAGGDGGLTVTYLTGGALGDNTVRYRIQPSTTILAGETLDFTFHVLNAMALGTPGASINVAIRLYDVLSDVDTPGTDNVFDSQQGTTGTLLATNTSTDILIDVATGSTEFIGSGADFVSATEIIIGTVQITDTGALEDDLITLWAATFGNALVSAATLVLTGQFDACVPLGGAVILDPLGLNIPATTITNTTVTFNLTTGNLAAIIATGLPLNVHLIVDGATAIPETIPAVTGTIDWTDPTYRDSTYTGTFRALRRNGITTYAGPILGTGLGADGGFRIVNRSNSAANVYFQAQSSGGLMLPQVLHGNLAAGATEYVPVDTFLTEVGLTISSSANAIITLECDTADVFWLSYGPTGWSIVPLTKTNNQVY